MTWPSFELSMLEDKDLPVLRDFKPIPHTSRKGWLARYSTFPQNPFTCDVDEPIWETTDGRVLALREIAGLTTRQFWFAIRRLSDPFTFRLIGSVMRGRAPSLLEVEDRPPEYEDVGRLCKWDNLFPIEQLRRSRYERVLIHAINGERLHMFGRWYTPVGMQGWSRVVFRSDDDHTRHVFSIDYLLNHLRDWGEPQRRAS
jgi:hypothetical protein